MERITLWLIAVCYYIHIGWEWVKARPKKIIKFVIECVLMLIMLLTTGFVFGLCGRW